MNVGDMSTLGLKEEKTRLENKGVEGSHIPFDIRDTIGLLISEQQELKVRDAITYLEAYLDGANVTPELKPEIIEEPKGLDEARVGEIIATAVGEAIAKAQGKI